MNILLLALFLCLIIATQNSSAQLPTGPGIILHRNGVTYQAWKYPNGKTRCVRTIDRRGVANGVEYRWRQDGSMSSILSNINGQTVFLVQLDEGGKCRGIETYSSGQFPGPSISFYPSGLVKSYELSHEKELKDESDAPVSVQPHTVRWEIKSAQNSPQVVATNVHTP